MKKILGSLLMVLGLSATAFAEEDHSANFCSEADASVCAHLGHMTELATSKEVQFVAHFLMAEEVTDLKVTLWMPEHNHGSSPVAIELFSANHFQITKAFFPMTGLWHVVLDFNAKGSAHQIVVPLNVVK